MTPPEDPIRSQSRDLSPPERTADHVPTPEQTFTLTPPPEGSTGDDSVPLHLRQFIKRLEGLASPDPTAAGVPPSSPAGCPTVPGYSVTGEIARGGMGRVLAARDLTFGLQAIAPMASAPNCLASPWKRPRTVSGAPFHPFALLVIQMLYGQMLYGQMLYGSRGQLPYGQERDIRY